MPSARESSYISACVVATVVACCRPEAACTVASPMQMAKPPVLGPASACPASTYALGVVESIGACTLTSVVPALRPPSVRPM